MDCSGPAIAIGALLDGIPESVVLDLTLLSGNGGGVPVVAAIFVSNLPEELSSAAGAILAMVADTMIPEAFARTQLYTGLIATVGLLWAFAISRAGWRSR